MTLLLVSVLGAIAAAVIGTLWYSMNTPMGKIHMTSIGFMNLSKEEQAAKIAEAKPHMWKSYLAQLALSCLTAGFIGFITTRVHKDAYMYVSMIWAAFVLPNIGSALLWGAVDRKIVWQKFFSDSLNSLVTLLAMAFIANLFF